LNYGTLLTHARRTYKTQKLNPAAVFSEPPMDRPPNNIIIMQTAYYSNSNK